MDAPPGYEGDFAAHYEAYKGDLQKEHEEYIHAHPELRQIVSDFMGSLLTEKPRDVYTYAAHYFSCLAGADE